MHAVWLLTGLSLLAAAVMSARGDDYPRTDLLDEPAEVSEAAGVVVLDARPRAEYDAGHAPGARWVDHADWAASFEEGPTAFVRRCGAATGPPLGLCGVPVVEVVAIPWDRLPPRIPTPPQPLSTGGVFRCRARVRN